MLAILGAAIEVSALQHCTVGVALPTCCLLHILSLTFVLNVVLFHLCLRAPRQVNPAMCFYSRARKDDFQRSQVCVAQVPLNI